MRKAGSWLLALAVAAFFVWCLGQGFSRAEEVRRQRIERHGCQERAWCYPLLRGGFGAGPRTSP